MKREALSIKINWGQVVTSLLIGAILGAIALVRLSDTNTIIIAGQAKAIENLENNTVSSELFHQHVQQQTTDITDIKNALRDINNKVDRLLLK